jgi:hypothetical protein
MAAATHPLRMAAATHPLRMAAATHPLRMAAATRRPLCQGTCMQASRIDAPSILGQCLARRPGQGAVRGTAPREPCAMCELEPCGHVSRSDAACACTRLCPAVPCSAGFPKAMEDTGGQEGQRLMLLLTL